MSKKKPNPKNTSDTAPAKVKPGKRGLRSRKSSKSILPEPRKPQPVPRMQRLAPIRHLYPFDSYLADMNGPKMHYLDEGEGEPIVMVHGNPTWSFYFRNLVGPLRDHYRLIVPDHIGCGLSEKPRIYSYTLSKHIDNLSRLIDQLGLKKVTLAIHDWGGAIGMGWAQRFPDLVKRIMVFNTAAFVGGPMPRRIQICRWPVVGDLVVRGLNGFVKTSFFMGTGHRERFTRDVRKGYLLPYRNYASRIAIQRFVRDIPMTPTDPSYSVLQEIGNSLDQFRDRPMAICWGMKDFCFNEYYLNEWVERFPDAEVHRFGDAGHYVVEDAHERIIPIIKNLMNR